MDDDEDPYVPGSPESKVFSFDSPRKNTEPNYIERTFTVNPSTPTLRPPSNASSKLSFSERQASKHSNEHIIIRLERPIVGIEFKPHILIKNKTNNLVEKSERSLDFEFLRSKQKLKTDCYYTLCNARKPHRSGVIENLFNKRRFCSTACFLKDWHLWRRQNPSITPTFELGSTNLSNKELWSQDYIFSELLSSKRETQVDWEIVSKDQSYTPTEEDYGHIFKVRCTARSSPKRLDFDIADALICAMGESEKTEPVVMLPFAPLKRRILDRKTKLNLESQTLIKSNVSVLCYNLLADIYTSRQIYPYTAVHLLNWRVRRKLLLDELLTLGGDIMCLQEVQNEHYETFFKSYLEKDYSSVYLVKSRLDNSMNQDKVDGCLTLFKKKRFSLLEVQNVEYNQVATERYALTKEARRKKVVTRLSKDNVASLVMLRDEQSRELVCVVNTHLHWDPEFADVKLWQASVLMEEVEKLVQKFCRKYQIQETNLPVILCGDLNSLPEDATVKFLKNDPFEEEDLFDPEAILPEKKELENRKRIKLKSTYEEVMGEEPECTNYTQNFKGTIDYIFGSESNVKALRALEIPSVDELKGPDNTPLPNVRHPSDHVPLLVDLLLTYDYSLSY